VIPRLIELLGDARNREEFGCLNCGIPPDHWAGSALIDIGPASVPALAAALKHSNPSIARNAANSLGFFGTAAEDAVPALVAATTHDDVNVRAQALLALGFLALRLDITLPAIVSGLRHDNLDTRRYAAYALGYIGPAAVGPAAGNAWTELQLLLEDEVPEVREAAKSAIYLIESTSNDE
jgi:HEAT repeat protein